MKVLFVDNGLARKICYLSDKISKLIENFCSNNICLDR